MVGSNMGGIPGLLGDGAGGILYDPFSPGALAEVLGRLIEDPARRLRVSERRPSVKTIAEDSLEWEAVYRSAMSGRRQRATTL